jgi:hypothetical protein
MEEAAGETAAEAPEAGLMQESEADQETERAAPDAAAPAEEEAAATAITATGIVTETVEMLELPAAEAEVAQPEAEELADEAFDDGAPPALEATPLEADASEVATLPAAPSPTPAPVVETGDEGGGLTPLRVAQAVLGVSLIILLTATLLLRRQPG